MAKLFSLIPDAVLKAQARAGDPARNVWLTANAGSGKTHVLTERVIRLLLAGCDPAQILCLTYTKAAANVMQTRIFDRLSEWTKLDDETLTTQLSKLISGKIETAHLNTARRLFARALETPGGLKIQTIHAFCESILHQFPVEANIAGHFEMIDDLRAQILMTQARRHVIEQAWQNKGTTLGMAFECILTQVGEHALNELFGAAIDKRETLKPYLRQFKKNGASLFYRALELDETIDETLIANKLKQAALLGDDDMACCETFGGTTTKKFIADLQALKAEQDVRQFIPLVLKAYFDSTGEKLRSLKNILTKNLRENCPHLELDLHAKQNEIKSWQEKLCIKRLIQLNEAAYHLILSLNQTYDELKRSAGLLDFDDLIHSTLKLLKRSSASKWVHYKLDSAISHILVDEAQDTSPEQWQIIHCLSDEFFSGEGVSLLDRTLFAVGDEKQSIYSFQGAVPEDFSLSGDNFSKQARSANKMFETVRLDFSFRSTPDILAAVDAVFSRPENYQGLSMKNEKPYHQAIRAHDVGEVDIWAPLEPQMHEEPEDWRHLMEQQDAPPIILARQIAETIANWLNSGEIITGQGRPMQPGDIMVLVRSRDSFVHALSRELKNRSIAVAGSDRLRLNEHIAVRDLLALARFVLQPFDDLSLACALKSPLFSLNEEELYQISANRENGERLFHAMERQRDTNQKFDFACRTLSRYRALADVIPVYELYSHILSEDGGRRKILSRLGFEASDVLDAFMDYALNIQKNGLPGLQTFIETLAQTAPEIKRELGEARGEVRIMTVHAAKGLESAVVFLVDNGKQIWNASRAPKLLPLENGIPLWNPGKAYHTGAIETVLEKIQQKAQQEYRRLLYVGMTRAEDRLIICGYKAQKSPKGTWLDFVSTALDEQTTPLVCPPASGVEARRFQINAATLPLTHAPIASPPPTIVPLLPDFLLEKSAPAPIIPRPLLPSHADIMLIDEDDDRDEFHTSLLTSFSSPACASTKSFATIPSPSFAIRRGILIHQLLQYLPDIERTQRLATMRHFLGQQISNWPAEEQQRIEKDVLMVLDDKRLERLFAPTSRAEVSLTGQLKIGDITRPVSGQIDRLAVFDGEVLLADFKTGQPPKRPEDIAQAYLWQMAIYRALLAKLYPAHEIHAFLIYTREGLNIFPLEKEWLDSLLEKL